MLWQYSKTTGYNGIVVSERPRKTKIGTEVAHVTRDSDTTFKVKGQLAGGVAYCGGLLHSLLSYACEFLYLEQLIVICFYSNNNYKVSYCSRMHSSIHGHGRPCNTFINMQNWPVLDTVHMHVGGSKVFGTMGPAPCDGRRGHQ